VLPCLWGITSNLLLYGTGHEEACKEATDTVARLRTRFLSSELYWYEGMLSISRVEG
jgi:hypothetical protein